ncbi:MAG: TetR family transcriptional regulator [Proteobacteria bacterium]|nr:TetR family transcriptional regulator [Pseudomonadota bacterium]
MARKRAWQGAIQDADDQFAMKRQVVLRTAAQIFSRRGFHQTTLSDIADELHIAKPTLYHYFKSKDEILLEVQQAAIQQMLEAPVDPKANGFEQIRGFFHRYVEMIVDDFGTCLIMTGVTPLEPGNRSLVRKGSKSIELILRDMLKRGVEDGSIAPVDPKIAAKFMFGALNWIPYWYRSDGDLDVEGLADRAIEFVMRGLLKAPG